MVAARTPIASILLPAASKRHSAQLGASQRPAPRRWRAGSAARRPQPRRRRMRSRPPARRQKASRIRTRKADPIAAEQARTRARRLPGDQYRCGRARGKPAARRSLLRRSIGLIHSTDAQGECDAQDDGAAIAAARRPDLARCLPAADRVRQSRRHLRPDSLPHPRHGRMPADNRFASQGSGSAAGPVLQLRGRFFPCRQ